MIKIIADRNIPFLQGVLEPYAQIIYLPYTDINNSTVKSADCLIIRTRTACHEELLKGTSVKLITTATTGDDHIDKEFCRKNNISFISAAGCNSGSVVQYVAGALAWLYSFHELQPENTTVGIIGVGRIGSRVNEICKILGFKTLLNDPPRQRNEGENDFVSLDQLLEGSDIVTIHVPLEKAGPDPTFHLAGERFFRKLKRGAVLINTSRGPVVNTEALGKALDQKSLSRTITDVWEDEPQVPENLIQRMDIATPHIAGYSLDGKANGTAMCVREISRFFGFKLNHWFPADLPQPQNSLITVSETTRQLKELLFNTVRLTYKIEEDSQQLKAFPSKFEALRNSYPVRREFQAYQVKITKPDPHLLSTFKSLGFNVIQ